MTNINYLYNPDAVQKHFGKNHFVDKKLHFRIIERGTVLPHKGMNVNGRWTWGFGGVVDSKNNFVPSSFVRYGAGAAYTPIEEIFYSPETVVYLGMFYPVWGHCLTDNLRRLWFLKSDVFKNYFKNCRLVYMLYGVGGGLISLEEYNTFRRLLEILEVDVNRLTPIYRPVQFENIIMPDESFIYDESARCVTAEYRETIDRVRDFALKNQMPTSSKKIYYFYGKYQLGEERLAEYFKSKGYEIVRPEKLSLDEQLNLLINAESFASTLGSCSHNSIFLNDGTETIFIPRSSNKFVEASSYQNMLDTLHNLNTNYVSASTSIFSKESGLSCYIISEQLKKFFGDEFNGYAEDDFKNFFDLYQNLHEQRFQNER